MIQLKNRQITGYNLNLSLRENLVPYLEYKFDIKPSRYFRKNELIEDWLYELHLSRNITTLKHLDDFINLNIMELPDEVFQYDNVFYVFIIVLFIPISFLMF